MSFNYYTVFYGYTFPRRHLSHFVEVLEGEKEAVGHQEQDDVDQFVVGRVTVNVAVNAACSRHLKELSFY